MAKTKILGSQINLKTSVGSPGSHDEVPSEAAIRAAINDMTNVAARVHALTSKSTPVDDDETLLVDSAAAYTARKLSWANIKAALKSYLDAFYAPATGWVPAGETWLYDSANPPEYTIKISGDKRDKYQPGDRIKLTQGFTTKYFIVTKVTYSSPYTIVTVYGGTDYELEIEGISDPYYSKMKSPQGFPLDPEKWSVTYINYDMYFGQQLNEGVWYNTGVSMTIPAGCWKVWYKVWVDSPDIIQVALSTNPSNADSTPPELMHRGLDEYAPSYYQTQGYLTLPSRTTCYLLVRVPASYNDTRFLDMYAEDSAPLIIKATCAYL